MIGIGHRQFELTGGERKLYRLAAALGGNGRNAVDGARQRIAVDEQRLVVVLGRHPLVIGKAPLDELGKQHHPTQGETDLGVGKLHLDRLFDPVEKLEHLGHRLARNDDARHACRALGGRGFHPGQPVAVGRHRAHNHSIGAVNRMDEDAVEIIARLFVGDRELGALDQILERFDRN